MSRRSSFVCGDWLGGNNALVICAGKRKQLTYYRKQHGMDIK